MFGVVKKYFIPEVCMYTCMRLHCRYTPGIGILILTPLLLMFTRSHGSVLFVSSLSIARENQPFNIMVDPYFLYCCFSLLLCHWVCFTLFWI